MSKAIYIRTSTEDQNPENQLKDCIALSGKDYRLYTDKQSAYKDTVERKDFKQLMDDIKTRKISDVYVWDFDRVYRNRVKFKEFLEFIKVYGCKLHSFNQQWMENINDIPAPWNEIVSDMLIQIFGYIAEEESALKGRRVKAAMRERKDGIYSYKGNKWGRKTISTFKQNRINKLRGEGKSIREISKHLNMSVGAVHKYIPENPKKTNFEERRS